MHFNRGPTLRLAPEMVQSLAFLVLAAAFASVTAFPEHLDCARKIRIGNAIMGAQFMGASTAFSIRLDKVACGGVLMTDTDYVPVISGIPSYPALPWQDLGVGVDPCILDHGVNYSAPNWMYLIDVTDTSINDVTGDYNLNPFPGANFTKGVQVWDGTGSLSGPTPCPSRSSGLQFTTIRPGTPPWFVSTASVLRFSQPGVAMIRLAWSTGPFDGVNVVQNCTYNVSAPACPAPPSEVCCNRRMQDPAATLRVTFKSWSALSSITVWNDVPSGPPFYQTDAQLASMSVSIGSGDTLNGCAIDDPLPTSSTKSMPGYALKVLTCGSQGDYALLQFPSALNTASPPGAVTVKVCTKANVAQSVPPDAMLWLQT